MKKKPSKYQPVESNNVWKELDITAKWNLCQVCKADSAIENHLI